MRMIHSKYGIEFALEENQISTLVVENPAVMCELFGDLLRQMEGEDGGWILSEADTVFPFVKKCVVIDNPLAVDCNEKRIITKLYKELSDHTKNMMYEEYSQLNSVMISFLEQLLDTVPYHLEMELGADIAAILKTYDVRMIADGVEPLEILIDYLRAISSICGIRVVWMLNLKQFFTREEVQQLYEFCFYEKIFLINIEGQKNYSLEQEKYVIIDKDLCLIEVSSD